MELTFSATVQSQTVMITIADGDVVEGKRHEGKAEGIVHGPIYKDMFGEDVGNTVGEAFAVMNGTPRYIQMAFRNLQCSQ